MGTTPFLGLLHFTLDMYLIMLNVKQGDIKYHFFESLVQLDLGLNPGLLDHWQTLYPIGQHKKAATRVHGLIYLFNGISTPYGLFNAKV